MNLIGADFSFPTPGRNQDFGAYAGLGVDYKVTATISAFASAECGAHPFEPLRHRGARGLPGEVLVRGARLLLLLHHGAANVAVAVARPPTLYLPNHYVGGGGRSALIA